MKYVGVQRLIDGVIDFLPSPLDLPPIKGHDVRDPEKVIERRSSPDDPFSGFAVPSSPKPTLATLGLDIEEQRAVIGDDPFPLGLAAMGRNIDAIQGSVEQGLLRRPLSLADIYYRTTLLT